MSKEFLGRVVILLTVLVLFIFLYWRLQLGIWRYLDADEMTHLHWGYSFFIGEKPYTDFFYLFPPFFLYIIASIIAIFGRGIATILAARVLSFIFFLLVGGVLYLLAKKLRNGKTALFSVVIFSFLPLPYDKLLEIRPDLPAILLSLGGLYLFMEACEKNNKIYYFLSGLFYSLSLVLVPKTLFFVVAPFLILIYRMLPFFKKRVAVNIRISLYSTVYFLIGLSLPLMLLLLMLISYGKPLFGLYSITFMASEITTTLGRKFYMHTNLFFYPNETYYGFPGVNSELIVNLFIYLAAAIFSITRLLSSYANKDSQTNLREFLLAITFWANLYAFIKIIPLKHAQYLITLAPFIAFYFADLFQVLLNLNRRSGNLLTLVTLAALFFLNKNIVYSKLRWTNNSDFLRLKKILATIAVNEPVFDLTGETIFYPNGYYFCCLPYGQYEEALRFSTPNIERVMKEKQTKYVFTAGLDRLNVLPAMQARYIRENFINLFEDGSLLIKKDKVNPN